MITNRKMNTIKRIAFAAGDINRKSLIEWSYYNQDIVKDHELIASGALADILEGTIGVPVIRLNEGIASANHQLAALIAEQKIDILLFFWDPVELLQQGSGMRHLHDTAVLNNIIIAPNQASADFVLSSVLMTKTHSVPVVNEPVHSNISNGYTAAGYSRNATLKVNTIN